MSRVSSTSRSALAAYDRARVRRQLDETSCRPRGTALAPREVVATTSAAGTKHEDVAHGRTLMAWAIAIWFVAAFVVGLLGWVNQPGKPPVVLLAFFVVPIAALIAAYKTSPSVRAGADSLSLTVLVGAHVWRLVGVFFVTGALGGAL